MKQIKSKKSPDRTPQLQRGVFSKANCQLTSLPTELYSLSNLLALDISWNCIADLSELSVNSYKLKSLRTVRYLNLSHNMLPSVQSLKPLAEAMKDLEQLDIRGNPLDRTLNYQYQLAFLFEQIRVTIDGTDLTINDKLRREIFELHHAGSLIDQFLQIVAQPKTFNQRFLENTQAIVEKLKELQSSQSLLVKSQGMFQQIRTFLRQTRQAYPCNFAYSLKGKHNIDSLEQYEIPTSSFSPQIQQPIARKRDLSMFYYRYMARQPKIQAKLLQDLEVDEETHACIENNTQSAFFDSYMLIPQIVRKWQNHQEHSLQTFQNAWHTAVKLKNNLSSAIIHQNQPELGYSPLKSIQTGPATQRQMLGSRLIESMVCYFGFDSDWFELTRKFLIHRLLSFLKHALAPISLPNSFQKSGHDEGDYGEISEWKLLMDPKANRYETAEVLSPKSRNKFIISSSVSVLQSILTKIAFRKIRQAKILKRSHLLLFEHICSGITLRVQRLAFRKVSQASFRFQCILSKLHLLKLRRVFQGWNQIKKKKIKLLRTLAKRKTKKDTAFLSVALTQWRITARHLTTYIKLRRHSSTLAIDEKLQPSIYRSLQRSTSRKQVGRTITNHCLKGQVFAWRALKMKSRP